MVGIPASVILLMPREAYILSRFMAACLAEGVDTTICIEQPRQGKWQLVQFVNGEYGESIELDTRQGWQTAVLTLQGTTSAVVPTSEFSVQLCEHLAAALGVMHNPLEAVSAYRDKYAMRLCFRAAGVAQPDILARFTSLSQVDSWDWASVTFPLVVKPQDLTSSLYVRRVEQVDQARALYRRIFKHTQSFGGVVFSGAGLLETWTKGPEFSAECVVQNGRLAALFVTTKFVSGFPACDEIGHLSGTPVDAGHRAAIEAAARQVVQAWRLDGAVLHIEYKWVEGRVVVMEAACRIGGDFIPELVHRQHGVNLERELVRIRLQRPVMRTPEEMSQPWGGRNLGGAHGVRFLFGDSIHREVLAPVTLLRQVIFRRASHPARGFGIHQRIGYQILQSPCVESLHAYLSIDCKPSASTMAVIPPPSFG